MIITSICISILPIFGVLSQSFLPRCVSSNTNCKNRPLKTLRVRSFSKCNDECESFPLGCNFWTYTQKTRTCTLRILCETKSDRSAVTGRRGCPPEADNKGIFSPPLGTAGADPCDDSEILGNARNSIDLYTSGTDSDAICVGARFNLLTNPGRLCGQDTSSGASSVETIFTEGDTVTPSHQNCVNDIQAKVSNGDIQYIKLTNRFEDSTSCGYSGGGAKLQHLEPPINQFGSCCLTNFLNAKQLQSTQMSSITFVWKCFGTKYTSPSKYVETKLSADFNTHLYIKNDLSELVNFIVDYYFCSSDGGSIQPGQTQPVYRGLCAITSIHATIVSTGQKCSSFTSAGTYHTNFAIESNGEGGCKVVEV